MERLGHDYDEWRIGDKDYADYLGDEEDFVTILDISPEDGIDWPDTISKESLA